jgi:hypothetical protein
VGGEIVASHIVEVQVLANAHFGGGPADDGAALADRLTGAQGTRRHLVADGQVDFQGDRNSLDQHRLARPERADGDEAVVVRVEP